MSPWRLWSAQNTTAAPGDLDVNFLPGMVAGTIVSTAIQPDGKIVIGGSFFGIDSVPRNHIARLEADGAVDTDFNPNANNFNGNDQIACIAVQPDGKTIIGGGFTRVGGVPRTYIARVLANGAVDTDFNPNANGWVQSVFVQRDGKIIVGGAFTTVGGVPRSGIARLHFDGTLDTDFVATVESPNGCPGVICSAVQTDGKILVRGHFSIEQFDPKLDAQQGGT